jgi:hypothetical protein
MAWVRIVRFGQTVPVRSPSKPSLALFSVGESRLAAAIARPVAPLLGFALVAVLVMLTGAVPAHAKVTVTVSEEVVARGETAMIRAAVRPKAKFCTYWLKGRTRKMLSTKRVRNGQSTLRYVTKALVPGTYRVTVYCGKSGKGSARLKVGDTTPATTTRVPGGDLQCCGERRSVSSDRSCGRGGDSPVQHLDRKGRDMDRGDSQLLVR